MVKMINAVTGIEMWVANERVEVYRQRGHKLVAPQEPEPEKPKRKRKTKKGA